MQGSFHRGERGFSKNDDYVPAAAATDLETRAKGVSDGTRRSRRARFGAQFLRTLRSATTTSSFFRQGVLYSGESSQG